MSDASRSASSEGRPGACAVAPEPDALQVGNHSIYCQGKRRVNRDFIHGAKDSLQTSMFGVAPSSSAATAKRGMMSRLWVLFITSGLALRSDWEELEDARGRRLKETKKKLSRDLSHSKNISPAFVYPSPPPVSICPSVSTGQMPVSISRGQDSPALPALLLLFTVAALR